MAQQAGST